MTTDSVTIRVDSVTGNTIKKKAREKGVKQGDIVAQQFAVTPQDPKIGPLNREKKMEQGVIYISSATTNIYTSPKVDVKKIKQMLEENPYIVSKLEKRSITYFPERPRIEVYDPKQNLAPDETKIFQNMCELPDVMLSDKIILADHNAYGFGFDAFNPVWTRKGGRVYLQKLRHLPAWSFDTRPTTAPTTETWSPLLPGVILGADGTPEYWQRKNSTTLETDRIDNIMIVKDPKDESLAGKSKLIPLFSICEMIKYVLNTEMQVIARAGAPIFFIQITNPRDSDSAEIDGGLGDVDFAMEIIKNTSKDNSYVLRDNMTVIPIPFDPKKDNLATEAALKAIIDDYFSISNQISKNGTLIGGSAIPEFKLLIQAIRGLHNWLLAPFEQMLNQYFVLNGYPEGWTVKLSIDIWEEDKTEIHLQQGDMAWKWGVALPDELRKLAGLEPADAKTWDQINAYYAQRAPIQAPAQFTQHVHQFSEEGEGEPLDPIAKSMYDEMDDELESLAKKITNAVKGIEA